MTRGERAGDGLDPVAPRRGQEEVSSRFCIPLLSEVSQLSNPPLKKSSSAQLTVFMSSFLPLSFSAQ